MNLAEVAAEAGYHLEQIACCFKNPKVTLLVRSPDLADGDFILTDDELEAAVAAIQRLADRSPVR